MSDTPELGADIAGYRLESVLGAGGMGIVYLARGPQGGICALKVLPRRLLGDDPTFATRFKREAQYAEALDHPHVVELYEAGEAPDGTLYIAMQYVDGPDLGVLIRRDGAFSLPVAVSILGQIGDALDSAHATGLVHRDVKPANIIVADDPGGPQAYLADFGLSKNRAQDSIALTKLGQLIGTMSYTAPEEIMSTEPRDHRVDIYSLGCVLYEAVVGKPPFVRERDIELLYAHVGNPRPSALALRPDLPAGFDEVIAKAMAIAPDERYSSCNELIAAVRALLPGEEEELEELDEVDGAPAAPAAISPDQAATPVTSEPAPEEVSAPLAALVLLVRSGLGHGLEITVEDEVVLGRLVTLDGALAPDHSISRRHARISRGEDGGFVVEDEHSRNGTFLNDERIETPHPLHAGDLLKIGSTIFLATVPDAAAESATDSQAGWVEAPQPEAGTDSQARWVEVPQADGAVDAPAEWVEAPQPESAADTPADWVEAPQADGTTETPADSEETPQAESAIDAPADWVEVPQAESSTDAPADWVETPEAESSADAPADWVEAPQAESPIDAPADSTEAPEVESSTDAPADWVEAPQAESSTDAPADWVETPPAGSSTDAPADAVEIPQAESSIDAPADSVETPLAESATDTPADWVEAPQAESSIDAPAEWVEAPPAESSTDAPADWVETPQAESSTDTPADAVETPPAESSIDAPADWVEAPQAESSTDAPADAVETPPAESSTDAPAEWVEAPPAESSTDAPADWVETPQAGSSTDAPADAVEIPQAESAIDAPAEWVEAPQAERATDPPADEIEVPQDESATDAPAEWVETPQAESAADTPADAVEIPQDENAIDAPADWTEAPEAETATDAPAEAVEIPRDESAIEAPADRIEGAQVSDVVLEGREPGSRLALRLEYDLEAGELIVAIENGASVRLVREGDEWYVESA